MSDVFWVYPAIGVVAGVLAGLLGVGGGLVIVPALVLVFAGLGFAAEVLVHLAVGTSLMTIIATGLSSTLAHHRHGAVDWSVWRGLSLGLVPGAVLGAGLADSLRGEVLRVVVGVFVLMVAAQVLVGLKPTAHRGLPGRVGHLLAGGAIGSVSAVVGIGGGSLTVPWLLWHKLGMASAVAISAACGVSIAVAGAVGFMLAGLSAAQLPPYTTGYVYWPAAAGIVATSLLTAPLGAWLAHRLPAALLKRVFGGFLLLVGLKLFDVV